MKKDKKSRSSGKLKETLKQQRARIVELERQVDYFQKRFVAAKQAAAWLESKLKWKLQDSFGT